MSLLFDRGRLGVALGHDDPPQIAAMLARYLLPGGSAQMIAEVDLAIVFHRREKNSPAVFRHLHEIEVRPAAGLYAHGGAQIYVVLQRPGRTHIVPPTEKLRLPMFEGTL